MTVPLSTKPSKRLSLQKTGQRGRTMNRIILEVERIAGDDIGTFVEEFLRTRKGSEIKKKLETSFNLIETNKLRK